MCGRFTLRATPQEVAEHFALLELPGFSPRYNIGPGQMVGIVRAHRPEVNSAADATDGTDGPMYLEDTVPQNRPVPREWVLVKWGLIPHWANDPSVANRLINARAETVTTKPAFRAAFRYRRCLIPADGLYEWATTSRGKQPIFIRLREDKLFALAGLWDQWQSPSGEVLETCTILTVEPNPLVARFHNRMPLILPPEAYDAWMDPTITQPEMLRRWMKPYPEGEMESFPVTSYVNSIRHEGPRCIEPAPVSKFDHGLFEGE